MNGIRVLLVDDEQDFTEVLSERLESRGVKVDVSSSGERALEMAEEAGYDAVVLDLAMPGMDGIETLKRMVKMNPKLQVILLTGQGTLEAGVEAMRSGAMEFMTKPAPIDELMEKIVQARNIHQQLTEQEIEQTLGDIMRRKGW